jgi:2-keto-myo-inositol isomerase
MTVDNLGGFMKTCINGATTMPYSFEEDVKSASAADFEAVEIWASKLDKFIGERSVEAAKELLEANNLKVAALCPWRFGFFGDPDDIAKSVRRGAGIAQKLGCNLLLVCPDGPPKNMSRAEAVKAAGAAGRRYAQIAGDYGVSLAIEPLGGHPFVPGAKEALAIVNEADHPNLGLMMDLFHYYKSGVMMAEIEAIPVEKLLIIHVDDCEDQPRAQLNDGHRLYPGLGVIPVKEMLGVVKRKGYDGYLSVELFRKQYWEQDATQIAREAKRHLDQVMAAL